MSDTENQKPENRPRKTAEIQKLKIPGQPTHVLAQPVPLADIARARVGRGGIDVHCFKSGRVRENDEIVILEISFFRALAMRWRSLIDATR